AAAPGRREHPGPPHRPGPGGGSPAGCPPGAAAGVVPAAGVRAARPGTGAAVHRYRADRWLSSTGALEWSVRCQVVHSPGVGARPPPTRFTQARSTGAVPGPDEERRADENRLRTFRVASPDPG